MKTKNFFINHHLMFIACVLAFISCEDEIVNRTITNEIPVDVPVDVPIDLTVGKIQISNAEDLAKIGVEDDYPLSGAYCLTQDIDLSDLPDYAIGWTPIGSIDNPFTGDFYGNNKTIKYLIVKDVTGYTGFFAALKGAYIHDLNLEIANSLDDPLTTTGLYNIGGLAGYAQYSTIEDIIIKTADGVINPGVYINPASIGDVTYLGGIAGKIDNSIIKNSLTSIALKFKEDTGSKILYVGGITAYSTNTLTASCAAKGSIEVIHQKNWVYAGGVIALADTTYDLKDLESSVKLDIIAETTGICAGGIIGQGGKSIINCRVVNADDDTPLQLHAAMNYSGTQSTLEYYFGGIAGNAGVVSSSYVSGNVDIQADISSTSSGTGSVRAGGIGGMIGSVSSSYVSKDVSVKLIRSGTAAAKSRNTCVGGIAGLLNTGIDNCYSLANVSLENSSPCTINEGSGQYYYLPAAGGIAGASISGTIKHSYFGGTVTVDNTDSSTLVFAGGLAGYSAGEIDASFAYNPETGKPAVTVVTPIDGPTTFIGTDGNTYSSVHRINGDGEVTGFANWAKGGSPCFVTINGDPLIPANNSSGADGDNIADISGGLTEDFLANEIGSGGEDYVWDFTNVWQWDNSLGIPTLR